MEHSCFPGVRFNGHGIDLGSSLFSDHAPCIIEAITLAQALAVVDRGDYSRGDTPR